MKYIKLLGIICLKLCLTFGCEDKKRNDENEVSAGEITAGEVTSGETVAGEVFAGEVTSGETTAGEITAGEMNSGETTAGEITAGEMNAGETTAGQMVDIRLEVNIQKPEANDLVTHATTLGFEAMINIEPVELAPYISWELSSDLNLQIPVVYDSDRGIVQASLASLENQNQTLLLTARIAPGFEQSFQVPLRRDCHLSLDFNHELDQNMWQVVGSAIQDPRGWLEMTGLERDRVGGIFLIGAPFTPGDLDVRFRIASGACDEIGTCAGQEISDGYAMSIWNITTNEIDDLWSLVGRGGNGAGVSLQRVMDAGLNQRPEGFTIEFDTYPNRCPNNGFYDPVQAPHVEIYFDGKYHMAGDHLSREERCMLTEPGDAFPGYWSEAPVLRDNQWHEVRVLIQGNYIRVFLDEQIMIDTLIPNFQFKGGVLAFSGGSGAVPAFQRFDDLIISSACTP